MRIWQIDPVNLTPYYNIALCEALAAEGHQVRYVTSKFLYDSALHYPQSFTTDFHYFRPLEHEALLRFPRARKVLRTLLYLPAHRRLLAEMHSDRPEVVHFQWSRLPVFDRWLAEHIRQRGIPMVHTIHDVSPLFMQGRFTGRLQDVYAQMDALVVHTEDSRQRFLQTFPGTDPARLHVIPHIALKDRYLRADASQALARQLLHIPPDAFVVLFFGVVKHYKGVDVLAEALPLVKSAPSDFQVWIVGRPETEQDVQQLDALSQMPNVHTHRDYVPSDVMWQYHLAADVIVFPYRDIFQSGALLSAMGYGRAVIITDVGGLPEGVDGNGWIVPPENPQALALAIQEAAEDRERLARMGQRSLEIVQERYAPAQVAEQHVKLYRQLAEKMSTVIRP